MAPQERERLRAAFLAGRDDAGEESTQYAAELFLDYRTGYLHRDPLAWGPMDVTLFLLDYVPRRVVLDPADRDALPRLLGDWVRFTLSERGTIRAGTSRWSPRCASTPRSSSPRMRMSPTTGRPASSRDGCRSTVWTSATARP